MQDRVLTIMGHDGPDAIGAASTRHAERDPRGRPEGEPGMPVHPDARLAQRHRVSAKLITVDCALDYAGQRDGRGVGLRFDDGGAG